MSPLDRQNDNLLDTQPQTGVEGGDLNGGFSPQSEVQAWHESGSADDLTRSLIQVQQQEAWLQSQSVTTLLDQGTAQVPLLKDWAGGSDTASTGERTLVVVHTGLPNWQQQLNGLGQNDELLLVAPDQNGIQLVQDALAGRPYERVQLLLGETWSSNGASWQLGRDALGGDPQRALDLAADVAVELLQVPAIPTTALDSADGLLDLARQSLQIAHDQGRLETALAGAFSDANQDALRTAALAFLDGSLSPTLQWARFESSNIRGAYLSGTNTILLSEHLKDAPQPILQAVLLEELGHWLEQGAAQLVDSPGDEGEGFADLLLGADPEQLTYAQSNQDQVWLELNGQRVAAELASVTSGGTNLLGTSISLMFDENMKFAGSSDPSNVLLGRFELIKNGITIGGSTAFSGYQFSSPNPQSLNLLLNSAYTIQPGDTISLRYNDYSTANDTFGVLEYTAGTDLASISSLLVTNNATSSGGGGTMVMSTTPPSTMPPAAPVITAITDDQPPVTGTVISGAVTNDTRPTLTITAATGSTVRVFDNGALIGQATETSTAGTFTFTPNADLWASNSHSFTAKSSDAAGNLSSASSPYSIAVGVTGDGTSIGPTDLTLTLSSRDSHTDSAFELVVGGYPKLGTGQTVVFESYGWKLQSGSWFTQAGWNQVAQTSIPNLPTGVQFRVKVKDSLGNPIYFSNPLIPFTTGVILPSPDSSAPATPIINGTSNGVTPSRPVIQISGEAGSTIRVFDGANLLGDAVEISAGQFQLTPNTDLAPGTHLIYARAIDTAGNSSSFDTGFSLAVSSTIGNSEDTTAPTLISDLQTRATLNSSNTLVTLRFTEALKSNLINAAQFRFTDNAGASLAAAPSINVIAVNTDTLSLSLNGSFTAPQVQSGIRIVYTPESAMPAGVLEDLGGNDVPMFDCSIIQLRTQGTAEDDALAWGSQSFINGLTGQDVLVVSANRSNALISRNSAGVDQITIGSQILSLVNVDRILFRDSEYALNPVSIPSVRSDNRDINSEWFGTSSDDVLFWYGLGSDVIDGLGGQDVLSLSINRSDALISRNSAGVDQVTIGSQTLSLVNVEKISFRDSEYVLNPFSMPSIRSDNRDISSEWFGTSSDDVLFWYGLGSDVIDGLGGQDVLSLSVNRSDALFLRNSAGVDQIMVGGQTLSLINIERVSFINQSPSAVGSSLLAFVAEDSIAQSGNSIDVLFAPSFNDSNDTITLDSAFPINTFLGVVITANDAIASQGRWQWQAIGSSSWTDIALTGLSDSTALFLTATTSIRFLPASHFNGTPGSLTTRLVDSSASGLSNGSTLNVSSNGGSSPYSAATVALSTSIFAVNDAPIQTGTLPSPLTILEDSANTTAVSLGMANLNYSPGGGSDESGQTLSYTISAIPSFISLFKADGTTAVNVNTTLTLSELQGLTYKTVANANGTGNVTWSVQDSGGTANGGVNTLNQSLAIAVALAGSNTPPADVGIQPLLTPGQLGVPYVLSTADLLHGVSDPDVGDTLQILDLQITGGSAVDNGNGTWTVLSGPANEIDLGRRFEGATHTFGVLDLIGGSLSSRRLGISYRVADSAGESLMVSRGLDLNRPNPITTVAITGVQLSFQRSGTVVNNGNGTWSITPDPEFSGRLAIEYQVWTGGQTSTATFASFDVLPVNDRPTVQVPAAQSLLEDTTLTFSAAGGNPVEVADGDATTLELRLHVNAGTLTLSPVAVAGLTVRERISGANNLLRISGTAAAINAALDGLIYTPLANRSGTDELTLQLSDQGQSGVGGNQNAYARVPIVITAVPGQPAPAGRPAALVGINTAPQRVGAQAILPNTFEDQSSTFTTAQLLQGFSDSDLGDQLRVENLRVTSGNGSLSVDATGQWTFTPDANVNGAVTLAYDVVDGHGGRVAASNGFTITAVNDPPRRLDEGPKALYVIEDAAVTPLGLANLAWATGAERDPATDQLRQIGLADEANQTLTFTITALPDVGLGEIGLLDANNAFVAVSANQRLTLAQMQGLQFRAVADAYGSSSFTYAVSEGAAAQGGLTTTETFAINVLAVNDAPVRTSPVLSPRVIDNTELMVDRDPNRPADRYKTVSLELDELRDRETQALIRPAIDFHAGGNLNEQISQRQQLLYRISRLPNPNVGQVLLADGDTAVVQGQAYSLDQLRDLVFRPARGVEKLAAAERLGELRLEVIDTPGPGGDPARATELKVPILIDTNKASGRAGIRIAGLTSDEQAIQAVLALDPSNPDTGFQNPAGGNGTTPAAGQAKGLNTSLYSQLDSENPLYLEAIGGNKILDGQEVNYAPSAVPFLFDLPIDTWAPTSWANGGPDPTHTLLYRSTLSGQLRSNDELTYSVPVGSALAGFTLSSSGAWSFDPLDPAYAGLTAVGATQRVTARYQSGTRNGEITIELRRTASTVVAEVVGNVGAMTTSRGDWIASNPEGRDKDRYFKYISEFVLTSYGAHDTGQRNDDGDKIFAWDGAIATADGQPLRQLDGTVITTAGYYDFTRRDGAGDGVEFVYETVSEKGKDVDYIVGMRFFLRNNVFGDNDPAAGNIRDPGAPVTILRELGVIMTSTVVVNETVRFGAPLAVDSRLRGGGSLASLAGTNASLNAIAARASVLVSSGSAGDTSSGLIPQSSGAGNDDGTGTGSGDGDGAGKGAGAGGSGAGAEKIAKGRGRGDAGDSSADGLGKGAGERGLRLDPVRTLATTSAAPDSLLRSLSDTNILGANLLDALALGAGLLYLLYGPKAVDQSKRGVLGWLSAAAGGGRRGAAAAAEQQVLSLILTRQEDGSLRMVAAQLTAGGVKLLAQQDLAAAATDAEALQAAAVDLIASLQQQGQRYDLVLLDGQLDRVLAAADSSLDALVQQRLPLATAELEAAVAAASPAEFAALQQWLNKPSQTLPSDSTVAQVLQRRRAVHEQTLAPDQAQMAAMLELSLALTWSQR